MTRFFAAVALCLATSAAFTQTMPARSVRPAAANSAADETSVPKLEHFDANLVDKTLDPCNDFYKYSCNKWLTTNPIPADQVYWSTGSGLELWNEGVLRDTLEAASKNDPNRTEWVKIIQKIDEPLVMQEVFMAATTQINIIGSEVKKVAPEGQKWALGPSEKLQRDIADKVDSQKKNIRLVQEGDNLLRISAGLSQATVRPENDSWKLIPVEYLGNSERIEEQKSKNPYLNLCGAHLIHPGQYVAVLSMSGRVLVADDVELLKPRLGI